jgi:hypothetical protein
MVALAGSVAGSVAGCSSGGSPAAHPSSHAPGAATAALPTGTRLGQILGGASLPAGWSHANGAGGGQGNSGSMYEIGAGPTSYENSCTTVNSVVTALDFVGWWASSYATMVLTYPSNAVNLPQVTLTVGAYKPGYAARTMAFAAGLIGRCHSFRDKNLNNDPVTTSVQAIPRLGQQNLLLTSVEGTSNGPVTAHMVLVREGNDIVGADSNNAVGGDVRPATLQGFAAWLLQLLQPKSAA